MRSGIVLRNENDKLYIAVNYINYIKRLGYDYDFITNDSDLDKYDLFLLPGGYDIDPKYYKEKNIASNGINKYNDELDFKIIDYCLIKKIPLIGICRGMQSIAVRLGCTLHQNINCHMSNNHFIKFDNKLILVNSYHHQAIKEIPDNIEILARALDGNIEAIRYGNIIGLQFHPEKLNYSLSNFNLKLSH